MNIGLIARKVGMTQIFDQDGSFVPVTLLKSGPCCVVQVKKPDTDGYAALQIGCEEIPEKKLTRARLGHLKKRQLPALRVLKELRLPESELKAFSVGQRITVDVFRTGDLVDVTAQSIGKGFQGVVKRHGFHGGATSHGSMQHRAPGSIGNTAPQRVVKGRKMAGHMGNRNVTVQNLEVTGILPEKNLIMVKGATPGPKNGLVLIRKSVKTRKKKAGDEKQ